QVESELVSLDVAMIQTCLPMVRDALGRQKIATGQFDYDDLVADVALALDRPRGKDLIRSMRTRFRIALIDEFQDTDQDQWTFFRRVFIDSNQGNLTYLIGDPKQAIYGFRGADVFTYQAARHLVTGSGTLPVPLLENFRSTPDL